MGWRSRQAMRYATGAAMKVDGDLQGSGLELRSLDIPLYQAPVRRGRSRRKWPAWLLTTLLGLAVGGFGFAGSVAWKRADECRKPGNGQMATRTTEPQQGQERQLADCNREPKR